jgi:hypothetical protein
VVVVVPPALKARVATTLVVVVVPPASEARVMTTLVVVVLAIHINARFLSCYHDNREGCRYAEGDPYQDLA